MQALDRGSAHTQAWGLAGDPASPWLRSLSWESLSEQERSLWPSPLDLAEDWYTEKLRSEARLEVRSQRI